MIPLQLTLKNFLSYREASLDFRGLHTACICGANGAGKSSLLEAITWAIWGQSRAATEDDVIYLGEKNVRVDFTFSYNHQTYRVIRSRQKGKSSGLEFQVENGASFTSLTGKGVRATQLEIISYLKLDYDTFVNSAYLRQGKADEFMLRRPTERKQVLADLLKLNQYEELAEKAKDLGKYFKGKVEQLEQRLAPLEEKLAEEKAIALAKTTLEAELGQLKQAQKEDGENLQKLQSLEHQRETIKDSLTWQKNQYQNLTKEGDRLGVEIVSLKAELADLTQLIHREQEITAQYEQLNQLQQEEARLSGKFQAYQDGQQLRHQLEQKLIKEQNEIQQNLSKIQSRLESLEQQEKEVLEILSDSDEVQAALQQLYHQRQRLKELDQLKHQVAPLLLQKSKLQTEIDRIEARLKAKLEQLRVTEIELTANKEQINQKRQALLNLEEKIETLDKKRVYQERVKKKDSEKTHLKERLTENQRAIHKQLAELQQKLNLLQIPDSACPLCEQPLNTHHRHRVVEKTNTQQQTLEEQIWNIQEEMRLCEKEIQQLNDEYIQISEELAAYDELQKQSGQLEAELDSMVTKSNQLQTVKEEIVAIERSLSQRQYGAELHLELQELEQQLQHLNYDEQTHALVRGEVERWRWAEIKQAKIEDASRRLARLNQEKPTHGKLFAQLQANKEQSSHSIRQEIEAVEQKLAELGYDRTQHNQAIASLHNSQSGQLRYQELQQAKQKYPQLEARLAEKEQMLQERREATTAMGEQIAALEANMQQLTDNGQKIHELEHQIQNRRLVMDGILSKQGQLQQSLTHLENLQSEYEATSKQLGDLRKQYRIYQELAIAFGKNGIQALMIENALPQLETQTNQILARLTGNQFHVQFLTQKPSASRSKKASKLIDTLEISIADARGTRAYETYSGGEAFRINFAIRLALARLLAQRAGTSLQMLIIDEGFGTQDGEGCERLIAAINAIAADFSCILTITHMPQFKEAFQTRIEINKTPQGSHLRLST